jgi:two-component system sensor kinase FixL
LIPRKAIRGTALVAAVGVAAVVWMLVSALTPVADGSTPITLFERIAALGLAVLLGLGLAWLIRDVGRLETGSHELQRARDDLEVQVGQQQASARDAAARLQSIIDSAVDAIIVIDAKGRIESFNQAAETLFGYPASEVVGRNVSMLMPSPYHGEHDGYLSRYLTSGEARIIGVGREVTGRRRDGTTFPVHLSVGEMSVGGERKFTGVLHDLSSRVRLEEQLRTSESRWRAVIESAVDGIVVIDAHGRIEAFNPAAERLFGYAEADVTGRNVNMLMPSPYHEEHDHYLARYLATNVPKIIGKGREVSGKRRDGTTFPLHLAVGEMSFGGERKFTGILHDLSARVAIEQELRQKTALALVGEMAAVIAHEVKNPLGGIRGAVQVIGTRLDPSSRDFAMVKEIIGRVDALNELLKDLLLFARPPQPRFTLVEVNRLIALTAELLAEDPTLKDVRITIEGTSPPIPADADLLRIVFLNLLVNAGHAMEGRGTITVSVERADATCRIAFRDTGPGIPETIRDKVFVPFFTTKTKGSGLGLATAKRIIEAHHGTIWIDYPSTGGTAVLIQLPAHAL